MEYEGGRCTGYVLYVNECAKMPRAVMRYSAVRRICTYLQYVCTPQVVEKSLGSLTVGVLRTVYTGGMRVWIVGAVGGVKWRGVHTVLRTEVVVMYVCTEHICMYIYPGEYTCI